MKKNLLLVGALSILLFISACGGSNGNGSDTATGNRTDNPIVDSTTSTTRPDTTQGLRTGQGNKELSDTAKNR